MIHCFPHSPSLSVEFTCEVGQHWLWHQIPTLVLAPPPQPGEGMFPLCTSLPLQSGNPSGMMQGADEQRSLDCDPLIDKVDVRPGASHSSTRAGTERITALFRSLKGQCGSTFQHPSGGKSCSKRSPTPAGNAWHRDWW